MATQQQLYVSEEVLAQLTQLLHTLGLSDNAARDQAEKELHSVWVQTRRDELLLALVYLSRNVESSVVRQLAAVLLRRLAFKAVAATGQPDQETTPWESVQLQTRTLVKAELLVALSVEQEKIVRHKLCDAISEITRFSCQGNEPWPEVLPTLFQCAHAPSEGHREAAFRIFAASPGVLPEAHPDFLSAGVVFTTGLQDPNDEVRLAAVKAAVYLMFDKKPNGKTASLDLLNQVLKVVLEFLQKRDETSITESVGALIELAEDTPKLFRPVIVDLVEVMIKIVGDAELEDTTRQSGLELMLSITESAPGMMRKLSGFSARVVVLALKFMTQLDDDPSWYTGSDEDDYDSDENWAVGEQAMDRLANALEGKHLLPIAFEHIPALIGSDKWQERHAALMAISAIAEGCYKVMRMELKNVIDMVLPSLSDPHPRVRWAACNAVGQMSTDFGPMLQNRHHAVVLSALIPVMDDTKNPRVQSHAAAALVNFSEGINKKIIKPYLDAIFERLLLLLQNTGETYVQEQAITTIATVADSAEDYFAKYYSSIMPLLIGVLRSAVGKDYRMLRGKAIECATLIALAVGKDVFRADANSFIEILRQTQDSITDPDDPQLTYLFPAWARLCKIMGQEFVPYMDFVMPPLLKCAQNSAEVKVLDEDDAKDEDTPEEGWEYLNLNDQRVGIKTSVLEEKNQAIELLGCYAKELGPAFCPFVPQVFEIVLPLLKFYLHDGVREAAAVCLPRLLSCLKAGNFPPEQLQAIWFTVIDKSVDVLSDESESTFIMQLFSSLAECVETLGDSCLDATQLVKITTAIGGQLKEFSERFQERYEETLQAGEDFEEADAMAKEAAEYDQDALLEISHLVHSIFLTHRNAYIPYFENLLPIVDAFLTSPHHATMQWAVCVLDDLVEFTGPESFKFHGHFLNQIIAAVLHPHPDVRQAACYGVGIMAQNGGPQYADGCAGALNNLFAVINDPAARNDENDVVTENAIAAVAKICKCNSSKFDVATVLPSWVASLPIVKDGEEALPVYSYLLELLDARHPAVIGPNPEQLVHLAKVFASALVAGILPDDLASRMVSSFKGILGGVSAEMKDQLLESIPAEDRQSLRQMGYF